MRFQEQIETHVIYAPLGALTQTASRPHQDLIQTSSRPHPDRIQTASRPVQPSKAKQSLVQPGTACTAWYSLVQPSTA